MGLRRPKFAKSPRLGVGTPENERLLEKGLCLGLGDEPAADTFGDLTRRCFGQLGGLLAVASNPVPLADWLSDEFDAMCPPTAFFQADADVSGKSGHFLTLQNSELLRSSCLTITRRARTRPERQAATRPEKRI